MNKFTEKAQDYFKRHPSSDECHVTSDARVFHTLGAAQSMAGTLDDQTIESYKRKVLEKQLKEVEITIDSLTTNTGSTSDINNGNKDEVVKKVADVVQNGAQAHEADKETKIKELLEMELVSGNYQQMKALASFFGLKPADQKADTLIASLTEFKTTLNK